MIVIIGILIIIALIYFPSKKAVNKEANLGKRHLENLDKIDPFAREVIQKWVLELKEELDESKLDEKTLNRLIGLKIAQSRNTGELGEDFKELPKLMDKKTKHNTVNKAYVRPFLPPAFTHCLYKVRAASSRSDSQSIGFWPAHYRA